MTGIQPLRLTLSSHSRLLCHIVLTSLPMLAEPKDRSYFRNDCIRCKLKNDHLLATRWWQLVYDVC